MPATGITLDPVTPNLLGKSGRAMRDELVTGTTDPAALADLARGKQRSTACRASTSAPLGRGGERLAGA